jgi:hypothetical protein
MKAKEFEASVHGAFVRKFAGACYVQRNGDNMTWRPGMERPMPLKSPPDLLVTSPNWHGLIECKAAKYQPGRMARISLDQVKPHQLDALLAFAEVGTQHHGIVAVCFYDGVQMNRGGTRDMYLAPAEVWSDWSAYSGRASANRDMFHAAGCRVVPWSPGGWVL